MSTITLRLKEAEKQLIKHYSAMNGMSVSDFARQAMLEKIEDEFDLKDLDEALAGWEKEPIAYSHEEAWRMIESEEV